VHAFQDYHTNVVVYDPWANPEEIWHEYNLISVNKIPDDMLFDAVVLAVAHDEFKSCSIRDYCKDNHVIYDIKGFLPKEMVDSRL
ncbi:MAG TPA: UDP binding domain-containing protein, partial [Saprospiraceae bacterium]|nr:UDP binding domain-containing protein [Saprospiraceae bacterium]